MKVDVEKSEPTMIAKSIEIEKRWKENVMEIN